MGSKGGQLLVCDKSQAGHRQSKALVTALSLPCPADASKPRLMYLHRLRLRNFRNTFEVDLELHPHFNFVFGRNAQGKTNLMEAIYYLAELKSFRGTDRHDLIRKGETYAALEAQFHKDDLSWLIQVSFTAKERKVLLNQKVPKSRQDYYSLIPLILFEPRHIYLFRESPSKRRDYLNRATYLQDVSLLQALRDYENILRQKNRLLKDRLDGGMLDVWNEQLARAAAVILQARFSWFDRVNSFLPDEYRALSHTSETFQLDYQPHAALRSMTHATVDQLYNAMVDLLFEQRAREWDRREALIGPHRDDFVARLDDRLLGDFGSQGENRSAIIALKMAQLKIFSERFQKTPLFLLDDVASELDEHRCNYLFQYLRDEQTQVFITTTENRLEAEAFRDRSKTFRVSDGVYLDEMA